MMHPKDILLWLNGRAGIIADQMVLSGGNFVLVVLLARWLGIEAFGHFALAWMAVLFALSLHQALITQPMFTFLGKLPRHRQAAWLGVLAGWHVPMAVLLLVSGVLVGAAEVAGWLPASWRYIGLAVALFAPLYLLQEFARKASFAERRIVRPLMADVVSLLLLSGGLLLMRWRGEVHLEAVLLWWCVALLGGLALMVPRLHVWWRACRAWPLRWRRRLTRIVWTRHYHYSKWLMGKALLQWLSGNAFIIAGASVLGPAAAGAVRMAQNVLGLTHVLFLSLESIVPVQAAQQLFQSGYSAFAKYMQAQTLRYGLITLGLLAIIALTAEPLTALLYGAEATRWAYVIQVYCLMYVLVYLGTMAQFAIRTLEQTQGIFWGYVASASLGALAVPMVKGLGMSGLLAGLIISQCVLLGIYLLVLYRNGPPLRKKAASESAASMR